MFDFSRFTDRTSRVARGSFPYANFTEDQIQDALANPGGLFLALKTLNSRLVTKGLDPMQPLKA